MRLLPGLVLIAALACAGTRSAAAQAVTRMPFGSTASGNEALSFNQTQGFAQAEVVMAQGEKHLMYVPLSTHGFELVVPFFRNEADITSGMQPLYLSVDNVKTIHMPSTGLCLEHMVLRGKPQRVLAAQVLTGPVELFSYAPIEFIRSGPVGFQPTAVIIRSRQQWFVRRPGGLVVDVKRGGFVKQMVAYLHDDPVLIETLKEKKMGFDDIKMLVRLYNQHQTTPVPAK
jgi:hypothetical protein